MSNEARGLEPRAARVAPLLFGSGLCALIYQVAWMREFRLVFGASTVASAAVLAIFIGGLGFGGLLIGPRADRHPAPLALYARLEGLIALVAATTPGLLWLVRWIYVRLGGSTTLGVAGGTALRLVLAALVLALPTIFMGGTLPAAARAVETAEDRGRRSVALLYGVNTLGAVAGSFLATFFMLEVFGTRRTLWLACLLNMIVAQVARALARTLPAPESAAPADAAEAAPTLPPGFVLGAAAAVGFAFFLMELVWYRMLGPLLGGTVFTFGIILSVALLGIGIGGLLYSTLGRTRAATASGFVWTCLLEAAAVALPFALGDRIAVLAVLLRPLGSVGFWGHVLAWSGVTVLVVLPPAIIAGAQFPLLIALLGRGRDQVGRQIGLAYAWNTAGAIAGSLAGGFGLLPALSAPGCWRAVAVGLVALGLSAAYLAWRADGRWPRLGVHAALAAVVGVLLAATGPTAAWRHSGIGAGRATLASTTTPNLIRDWEQKERRVLQWQTDGVESSVALQTRALGLTFVLNGKIDGHATGDAPTQVMSGLLGAILHGHARQAMVVGLGTGSTAGWLGVVPGMERVDVVEMERGVLEMARRCGPVNENVLDNPKVHLVIGDGREILLTTPRRYDVVFSEPSNPYRAGIASLFTREYYQAVEARLEPDGLFVQWMQAYEVESRTIRRIYATLQSVFPYVETWHTDQRNVLVVASRRPVRYPVPELRARIAAEPYRSALLHTWRVADLEGFFARYLAAPSLARTIADQEGDVLNTDDRNYVEFGFAHAVGRPGLLGLSDLSRTARARREDRPPVEGGDVDWRRVEDARLRLEGSVGNDQPGLDAGQRSRAEAYAWYLGGDPTSALAAWRRQAREPEGPTELVMLAEVLAEAGDEAALTYVKRLAELEPIEADTALARLHLRRGRLKQAAEAVIAAFVAHRKDPWPSALVMQHALNIAVELSERDPALAPALLAALQPPFATLSMNEERLSAALEISWQAPSPACVSALAAIEPNVPWRLDVLQRRRECYVRDRRSEAIGADRDLQEFLASEPVPFARGLVPGS